MKRDTTYHDGQMEVYRASSARNPQSRGDLTHVVTLLFNEMSQRVQDTEFAGQKGFDLSRKVATPRLPEAIPADTTLWVLIGADLYSVQWVDKSPTTIYWYMERVRRIER